MASFGVDWCGGGRIYFKKNILGLALAYLSWSILAVTYTFLTMNTSTSSAAGAKTGVAKTTTKAAGARVARLSAVEIGGDLPGVRKSSRQVVAMPLSTYQQGELRKRETADRRAIEKAYSKTVRDNLKSPPPSTGNGIQSATPLRGGTDLDVQQSGSSFDCDESSMSFSASCIVSDSEDMPRSRVPSPSASPSRCFTNFRLHTDRLSGECIVQAQRRLSDERLVQDLKAQKELEALRTEQVKMKLEQERLISENNEAQRQISQQAEMLKRLAAAEMLQRQAARYRQEQSIDPNSPGIRESLAVSEVGFEAMMKTQSLQIENRELVSRIENLSSIMVRRSLQLNLSPSLKRLSFGLDTDSLQDIGLLANVLNSVRLFCVCKKKGVVAQTKKMELVKSDIFKSLKDFLVVKKEARAYAEVLYGQAHANWIKFKGKVSLTAWLRLSRFRNNQRHRIQTFQYNWKIHDQDIMTKCTAMWVISTKKASNIGVAISQLPAKLKRDAATLKKFVKCFSNVVVAEKKFWIVIERQARQTLVLWGKTAQNLIMIHSNVLKVHEKRLKHSMKLALLSFQREAVELKRCRKFYRRFIGRSALKEWRKNASKQLDLAHIDEALDQSLIPDLAKLRLDSPGGQIVQMDWVSDPVQDHGDDTANAVVETAKGMLSRERGFLGALYRSCDVCYPDVSLGLPQVFEHYVSSMCECVSDNVLFNPRPSGSVIVYHRLEIEFLGDFIHQAPVLGTWSFKDGGGDAFGTAVAAILVARLQCGVKPWVHRSDTQAGTPPTTPVGAMQAGTPVTPAPPVQTAQVAPPVQTAQVAPPVQTAQTPDPQLPSRPVAARVVYDEYGRLCPNY